MDPKLADMREEYQKGGVSEDDVADDPITQFQRWFEDALNGDVHEPNGMTLATVDEDGQPTARIMLLKGVDQRGLTFFTNQVGRKAGHLAANPKAALTFWWGPMQRQVRLEGTIELVESEEADDYFASRPFGSRIGAWASPQSEVIDNRGVLEEAVQKLSDQYADGNVPRPPHWGGYRLVPHRVEFWQGRTSRLHDRLCYRLADDQWVIERLAP